MSLIPNTYMKAVVSIGDKTEGGYFWFGTGFLCGRTVSTKGAIQPFLVTNKHVFEGRNSVWIRMIEKSNGSISCEKLDLYNNSKTNFYVNEDPDVDIAVLPLNGSAIEAKKLNYNCFEIDQNSTPVSQAIDEGLSEGSVVYMLGFPMGLVNENSLNPICRMGCVSRINGTQMHENGTFLADIMNFPGNSGSPVVSRGELVSVDNTKPFDKSRLIGVVSGYIKYQTGLRDVQSGDIVETREQNSGLACVIPVDRVIEIVDLFCAKIKVTD